MSKCRVALVDDHPLVLAGLSALIAAHPGYDVVGEAACGAEAQVMVRESRPDILVMDLSLPDITGLDLAPALLREKPDLKILVLTFHEAPGYVQPLLAGGVRGYLLKRSAANYLIDALQAIVGGSVYIDASIEPVISHSSVARREGLSGTRAAGPS